MTSANRPSERGSTPTRRRTLAAAGVMVTAALAVLAFAVIAPARSAAPGRAALAAAPPATLYVTGLNGPVTAGQTVTVDVRLRSDTIPANAVQADLTFPEAELQYTSADVNEQVWGVTAATTGGSGSASVQVGSTTPVTGDTLVATITFTALQDGTPAVTVAPSSVALSADTNVDLLVAPPDGGQPPVNPGGGTGGTHGTPGAHPVRARVLKVRLRGRKVRVQLACPPEASSSCKITLGLRRGHRRAGRTATFTIRAARTRIVTVKLPAALARRVHKHPRTFRLRVKTTTTAGAMLGTRRLPR
jgi:hypothetical protein